MRIERIKLKNYKRLLLNGTQYFEWTPESKLLLLIGSNGSGKSSLIEELTPLPTKKEMFTEGGYKEILITNASSTYLLRNDYSVNKNHSFIKDNEELNQGGTFTVQKDLVWTEFGLDYAIHEVMTGITSFTTMAPAKRREWFMRLLPNKQVLNKLFTYHEVAKSMHNEHKALLKHARTRMQQEENASTPPAILKDKQSQVQFLSKEIESLYRERGDSATTNHRPDNQQFTKLCDSAKKVLHSPKLTHLYGYTSIVEVKSHISELERKDIQLNTDLSVLGEELETIDSLQKEQEQNTHLLDEKASLLNIVHTEYKGRLPILNLTASQSEINSLRSLVKELSELIITIPDNQEGYYNKEFYEQTVIRHNEMNAEFNRLTVEHDNAALRLNRLRTSKDITCPECGTVFKEGITDRDISELETVVDNLHTDLEVLNRTINQDKEYLNAYKEYKVYIDQYRKLIRHYPNYKTLFDWLNKERIIITNPKPFLNEFLNWDSAQEGVIQKAIREERIREIDLVLERSKHLDSKLNQFQLEKRLSIESKIALIYKEKAAISERLGNIKRELKLLEDYRDRVRSIERAMDEGIEEYREGIRQEVLLGIESELRLKTKQRDVLQSEIHIAETQEARFTEIQAMLDKAMEGAKYFGIIENALSPKHGYIAKCLKQHIAEIVRVINLYISKVWTYPLEVVVGEGSLDYIFPLSVDNGNLQAPDIGRGSSSQKDMINMAFKLLVVKQLRLTNYPFYLDEFGNTFDDEHRNRLIPFLEELVYSGQFSQLFYISHFATMYGAYSNAEVVVLDERNIDMELEGYNRNVIINSEGEQA